MEIPYPWPVPVFSVSEITSRIRDCIYRQFRDVIVEGEISNCKVYPSGHLYFTLKDDASSLKAVMFNFRGKCRGDVITDGTAVICKGRVDVYEKRGEYRLLADEIEVRGRGLLQVKFELLKEKLFREGLFDAARKRPLPFLPRRIGIITSPAGAAIRDMLKIIRGKFENMDIRIYPVRVQGDQACGEVVAGIEYFNREREVDVIILGRGGGSIEDLACFNEEALARAICASPIPIVSGVGHEIDFTIADFVADVRAPTPTAAADMVVRDRQELSDMLSGARQRLVGIMRKRLEGSRLLLSRSMVELREKRSFLVRHKMYLDELSNGLRNAFSVLFGDRKVRLQAARQRLADLNPENILRRGYSITVRADTLDIVTDAGQVAPGDRVSVSLSRGSLDAVVEKTRPG
ncbi:MAG: exodeoxyribonuclease VII large subunit [Syntrophorhabdales bacterium]|jgi:exodeoxyribonuclease VII large subunit